MSKTQSSPRLSGSGIAFRSRFLELLAVSLLFFVLFSLQLSPIWTVWKGSLASDLGDPLFNFLVFKWEIHQFQEGVSDLWSFPIYHPFRGSLLLSDHMLGTALQAWTLKAFTGSLIAAYNLLFFASFLLSAVLTYVVLRASRLSAPASLLAAAVFAMSPFRWSQASHLQILLMQWIPLTLFFWDRLLAQPRVKWALGFGAAYLLHLCGGTYLSYMIHFPLLVLLANRGLRKGSSGKRELWQWLTPASLRILVPTLLVAALGTALVFLPYFALDFDFDRPESLFRMYGTTSVSLLTPSWRNWYYEPIAYCLRPLAQAYSAQSWSAEKTLFAGFLPSFLGALGVVLFLRNRNVDPAARTLAASGLTSGQRWTLRLLLLGAGLTFGVSDVYTFAFELPQAPARWLQPSFFYHLALGLIVMFLTAWVYLRHRWLGFVVPARWGSLPLWPRGLLLVGAATLLLGFPVFFEPLSNWLPGLAGIRVPSRFYAFASFALAFFAARGFDAIRASMSRTKALATTAILLTVLALELSPRALQWEPPPPTPASHRWIAQADDVKALLELPFRGPLQDLLYMSYASEHWKPLANGFSGHAPPAYLELREVCCWPVPETRALEKIRELGVSHVLIHGGALEAAWARERLRNWQDDVQASEIPGVRQVYADASGDLVFAITEP